MPASTAWMRRSTWVVAAMVSPAVTNATFFSRAASTTISDSSTSFLFRTVDLFADRLAEVSSEASISLDV